MSKSSWTPVPKAEISAWISWFCRILSIRAFSTFRILPRIGRIAWYSGFRPDLAEPPAESPSTMKISHLVGSFDWQSGELARQGRGLQEALATRQVTGLAGRHARGGRLDALADDVRGLDGVAVQPVGEVLVDDLLDEGLHLGVAQLGLGLALELRLAQLHRDDRGQTLADVITREVVVLLTQQLLVARVLVDEVRQRRAEAFLVRAALVRVDDVREGVDALGVAAVPLHRDLEGQELVLVLGLQVDHGGVHHVSLAGVEVLHEVDDAALVVVLDDLDFVLLVGARLVRPGGGLRRLALVGEFDPQTLVEERHLLEPAGERLEGVLGGLEDVAVGPEGDRRAVLVRRLVLGQRSRRDAQLVVLRPAVAVGLDLDGDLAGQGVHHGDTHAVQTAGDRVAAAAELAARVQHRQYDLDGRLALGGDDAHRDASAVVDDAHAAVGQDRHVDGVRVAGQRLVHGVVDDLLHQVVQAALAGRADVHTGSLADRVQTLEDGDGAGVVRGGYLAVRRGRLGVGGRDVLVGVAGIGHEAPFLAQHEPGSSAGCRSGCGMLRW
ncbi:UNVERIFIED_CONTAM: hypothetical protein RKD50_004808 [Streptomyces canus]